MSERDGRKAFSGADAGERIAFAPPDDPRRLLGMALDLHRAGHLSRARALYEQVLASTPGDADALHFLGLLLHQSGDASGGEALIRRAIEASPQIAIFRDNLGALLEATGRPEEALAVLEEAERLAPGDVDRRFNLGVVLERLGRPVEAEASYREVLAGRPDDPDALFNLANVLKGEGHLEEAVAAYRRSLAVRPEAATVLNNLGTTLLALDRVPDAVETLRRAAALQPGSSSAHRNLGSALWRADDLGGALAAYERAAEIDPGDADAVVWLGRVLTTAGRVEEAVRVLADAAARRPGENALLRGLAAALRFLEPERLDPSLDPPLLTCLRCDAVAPQQLARAAALQIRLRHGIGAGGFAAAPDVDALAADPLLAELLARAVNVDPHLEAGLVQLRRVLLLEAGDPPAIDGERLDLAAALALQCLANDHLYPAGADETAAAAAHRAVLEGPPAGRDGGALERRFVLASLYVAPDKLATASALAAADASGWREPSRRLLERGLADPIEEAGLAPGIPALGSIADDTSRAVRRQYEDNPYPLWWRVPVGVEPVTYGAFLRRQFPGVALPAALDGPVSVLVAGCGTGQEAVAIAVGRRVSSVLGVDLSRRSLAHALHMARRHGVAERCEFVQGDLQSLPETGRRFDVIESAGVLHHMADPLAGWRALRDCLAPDGVMKIGLYSEHARAAVNAAREYIRAQGLASDREGVRAVRSRILAADPGEPIAELAESEDLYAVGTCRDLLFHPCEHQLTIPWIERSLATLELEFLGFELPYPQVRPEYRAFAPDDPRMVDLDAWHRFELSRPGLFAGLYVLWCRPRTGVPR